MLALAIFVGVLAIGVFCWLMFTAAIYALSFAVAVFVFLYTQQAPAPEPSARSSWASWLEPLSWSWGRRRSRSSAAAFFASLSC